ncbi:hypothetical protein [Citrobacter sp. Igbk 14]|uniref:hypothetical protein n=1 Tax=Citrobacter sp. Igbk 14 TaxID=2963960 RepID=UPI0010796954|nr:hypothetical protein [Citrobacter sp. Igbk 14]MDA8513295.1 hypothetical protein [Citrobacter sp. Igbk 14]
MKWINRVKTGCLLTITALMSCYAQAGDDNCQIMSSARTIDYGQFRKDDMRSGQTDYQGTHYQWLAADEREFTVAVTCENAQKIRIFVDGGAKQNKVFRFATTGIMTLKATDARLDNQAVQLIAINRGAATSGQSAAQEVTVPPGYGIAAMGGQELAGNKLVVTFHLTTYLSPQAFSARDKTSLEEILTLDYEAASS